MKTFTDFIEALKRAGFKVYTSDNSKYMTYCYFVKDDKIGYMQYDGVFSFTTVHKPNRISGTGFGMYNHIGEPELKHAYNTLTGSPFWASQYANSVVKYKNWEEFVKRETVLTYKEL